MASGAKAVGNGRGHQDINACGAMSYLLNGLVLAEAGTLGLGQYVARGRLQGKQDAHQFRLLTPQRGVRSDSVLVNPLSFPGPPANSRIHERTRFRCLQGCMTRAGG